MANVAATGATSVTPVIFTPKAPATNSPTRISKGGIAAAVILSIFGFAVIVALALYFLVGFKKQEYGVPVDQGGSYESSYEGGSAPTQPGAQSDHGGVELAKIGNDSGRV